MVCVQTLYMSPGWPLTLRWVDSTPNKPVHYLSTVSAPIPVHYLSTVSALLPVHYLSQLVLHYQFTISVS